MDYGRTWWGEKWLESLNDVYFDNRLPRGKTYANTGKVQNIKIKDNVVYAQVKGKYADYYKTELIFNTFSKKEQKTIKNTIYENPTILSSLLNNQLPPQLHEKLMKKGIDVFPSTWNSFKSQCECPDYAPICKHIAGLMYMLSLEIDKDPFQVFKLHNCQIDELLDSKRKETQIKKIDEILKEKPIKKQYHSNLEDIDISNMSNSLNNILFLLEENPLFFEKDFKKILEKFYTSSARFSRKIQNSDGLYYGIEYEEVIEFQKRLPHFEGDEENKNEWLNKVFIEKWEQPQKWENLEIEFNNNYQITRIKSQKDIKLFDNEADLALFAFLTELNYTTLNKFNKQIKFLRFIHQFTLELIEKNNIIPEFFKLENNEYKIRWIPTLFNEEVDEICEKLATLMPQTIIKYESNHLTGKEGIITIISFLISGYLKYYIKRGITKQIKKFENTSAFKIFFKNSQKFNDFNTKNYENLINQWLSKFSLEKRDYKIYLIIEEELEKYIIKIQVSINDKSPKDIGEIIETTKDENLKLNLIQDSYLINDLLPEFNNSIDLDENIEFNLKEFSSFFINILPLFQIMGISVILPKDLQKIFKPKLNLTISKNTNEVGYLSLENISQFDWKIAIGDTILTPEEFEKIVKNSEGLVKIANKYVILNEKEIKSIIKKLDKYSENLNQNQIMQAILSGEFEDATVNVDEELEKLIENIIKIDNIKVPNTLNGTLRDYQVRGYSWLVQNIKTGFGSILADDMGLGKTIQVLTTVLYCKEEGLLDKEKVLIVVPTSLITNWMREIKTFTPSLKAYTFHGPGRRLPKKDFDIIITTYGVLRRDKNKITGKKWFLTVIDEAQNIKNPVTKQTQSVKHIKSKHKIALSGTPVENRLSEYWSIFDFTNKGYLQGIKKFRDNYILPIEKEHDVSSLNRFKRITQPFILRRLKTDKNIIKDLPDKIVNDVYCNLTPKQSGLYQQTLDSLLGKIKDDGEGIDRKGIIFKLLTSLKQICNHPSQFIKSDKYSIEESGKMEMLISILENIIESDEKVLIFTQYVQMGDILKDLIEEYFNCEVLFLSGSLSPKKRDILINKFQNNPQNQVFILSLKAGGTGLNLTAAQNVIHYDLWWNPAVENQATDRAYRIGQKKNVMVYRFITNGTFEERINDMIQQKQELAEVTVGSGEKFITEMSNNELKDMLKLRK